MKNEYLEEIFIKEISENRGIIHKVCNIYCNDSEEKKDMMQEITLQLWKSFPNFKKKSKFSTWMYRIALNTAITNIRKSKRNPIIESFSEKQNAFIEKEDVPNLDDEINRLYKAIAKLNEVEKGIILLYLEKKTYIEIGEIIGLREKNISVKIVRIKSKLRKLLS
ncbi:MAG: sigma-70 family RNA polymerase sigma factor [Bacteroidetes bacterium]|nr:sigma-70 family RNA polymerase sigma factor [Bacteroidota bacterium]